MTIEAVCNQALDIMGYKRHIGSIWDGTRAARVALNCWAETRDALLIHRRPDWATQDLPLNVLKTAPNYALTTWNPALHPEIPWLYEYVIPDECLVPLSMKLRPSSLPIWRPRDVRFRLSLEFGSNTYTLLGNDPAPVLTCVNTVHNPDIWHQDFTEAMIETLAKKFEAALGTPHPQQEARGGEGGQQRANPAG